MLFTWLIGLTWLPPEEGLKLCKEKGKIPERKEQQTESEEEETKQHQTQEVDRPQHGVVEVLQLSTFRRT